jgi:hypothetical protein
MSERDELAELLRQHRYDKHRAVCGCSDEVQVGLNCDPETHEQHAADAILAAGYRKPRTVSAVEELDALPVGSVVRMSGTSEDARVAVKDGTWKGESEWFVADCEEWCLDSTELDDLPATVLYEAPND